MVRNISLVEVGSTNHSGVPVALTNTTDGQLDDGHGQLDEKDTQSDESDNQPTNNDIQSSNIEARPITAAGYLLNETDDGQSDDDNDSDYRPGSDDAPTRGGERMVRVGSRLIREDERARARTKQTLRRGNRG